MGSEILDLFQETIETAYMRDLGVYVEDIPKNESIGCVQSCASRRMNWFYS